MPGSLTRDLLPKWNYPAPLSLPLHNSRPRDKMFLLILYTTAGEGLGRRVLVLEEKRGLVRVDAEIF